MSAGRAPRGAGAARVHAELRRRILDLEIAPGADLDEQALAADFHVSRTPLREALNRLASEGLVVTAPNRGASVAPLNLTDFPAFIEALSIVQGAINAFAALRRTSAGLRRIAAAADRFEAAQARGGLAPTEANHAFHSAIGAAARNPHLAASYERLLDEGARLARVSFSSDFAGREAHLTRVVEEHRAMLAAIQDGDAAEAERLGHAHAALFQSRVLAYLSQNDASILRPVTGGNP